MKRFTDLVSECLPHIREEFPWDVEAKLNEPNPPLILDIREPGEFSAMHISGSLNVPRGILVAIFTGRLEDPARYIQRVADVHGAVFPWFPDIEYQRRLSHIKPRLHIPGEFLSDMRDAIGNQVGEAFHEFFLHSDAAALISAAGA